MLSFRRAIGGGMSTHLRDLEKRFGKLSALGASLYYVLLAGLVLVLPASAQTITYIHTNALGTVVDEDEDVTDGPGYTGHVSDVATGLSYMQQRYMDPRYGKSVAEHWNSKLAGAQSNVHWIPHKTKQLLK